MSDDWTLYADAARRSEMHCDAAHAFAEEERSATAHAAVAQAHATLALAAALSRLATAMEDRA